MKIKKKSVAGFILLLLLDQLTKLWAVTSLKFSESIPVIPNVLELYYLENRGAAFGMMQNRQWFFLLITVAVLAILIWVSRKIPEEKHFLPLKACIYFIGAGAAGNMIDRVFRKYVVDFIYFTLIDFPVFNVADIYVTGSAIVLAVLVLVYYKDADFERIFSKKTGGGLHGKDRK